MNANQNSYFVNYGDFRMQDWLLKAEISLGAKLTYSVLACCAGGKDHAWPSQEFLAEKVSASVRSVQRYLKELIDFGLIEKGRQWIKGQVRCIYRFLIHSLIGLKNKSTTCEQHDNLSPCSVEPEKNLPTNTTICQKQPDKMSPSLNKEEAIKGKEEIPPTPKTEILPTAADQSVIDSGKEGEFIFGVQEEDSRWLEAKNILSSRLSEKNFKTWISPLIFEANQNEAVLRGPNQFFINWIFKNLKTELTTTFEKIDISSWRLDLQAEEQIFAQQSVKIQTDNQKKQAAAPIADLASLSVADQYDALYKTYPKDEKRVTGFKVFKNLFTRNELPPVAELIKASKRQYNNNPAWQRDQGRYIPQLHNWLLEKRWLD